MQNIMNKLKNFSSYRNIFFDCDGVILNSNKIKSDAFYEVAAKIYGNDIAKKFQIYHEFNGGISRFEKFEYLISVTQDLNKKIPIDDLLKDYEDLTLSKILHCDVAFGLEDLRNENADQKWYVVSGASQRELRYIFKEKKIDHLFDGGIFGSPDDKISIINDIKKCDYHSSAEVFIGDSRYDYETAKNFNFDFIFVSEWTQLENWKKFCHDNKLINIPNIKHLVKKKYKNI